MKITVSRKKEVKIDGKVVGKVTGNRFPESYRQLMGVSNDFNIEFNSGHVIRLDLPYYRDVSNWIKDNPQRVFEESKNVYIRKQ